MRWRARSIDRRVARVSARRDFRFFSLQKNHHIFSSVYDYDHILHAFYGLDKVVSGDKGKADVIHPFTNEAVIR